MVVKAEVLDWGAQLCASLVTKRGWSVELAWLSRGPKVESSITKCSRVLSVTLARSLFRRQASPKIFGIEDHECLDLTL